MKSYNLKKPSLGFIAALKEAYRQFREDRNEAQLDTKGDDVLSLSETLNILVHIFTVARLKSDDNFNATTISPKEYMKTIAYYVGISLMIALSTALIMYVQVSLFQLLVEEIVATSLSSFLYLYLITFVSTKFSHLINFSVRLLQDWWGCLCVYSVRQVFDTNIVNETSTQQREVNDSIIADRVPAVAEHMFVLIYSLTLMVIYGVYAVLHLSPELLLMYIIVGGLAQAMNKGITCVYRLANEYEMQLRNNIRSWRAQLRRPASIKQSLGYNSMGNLRETLKNFNYSLFFAKMRLAFFSRLLELFSGICHSLTRDVYYLYFAFMVFSGYLTIVEVLFLLPFADQVAKVSGLLFSLPKLVEHTRNDVQKIFTAWNVMVEDYPINASINPIKHSQSHLMIYTAAAVLVYSLASLSAGISLHVMGLLILSWPVYATLSPSSVAAQLLGYFIIAFEYPCNVVFNYTYGLIYGRKPQEEATNFYAPVVSKKCQVVERHMQVVDYTKGVTIKDGLSLSLSYDLNNYLLNKQYNAIQVHGVNASGKTSMFGLLISGKSTGVAGLFSSDISMHIQPLIDIQGWDIAEITNQTYGYCLANKFGFSTETLEQKLAQFIDNYELGSSGIMAQFYNTNRNEPPSAGQAQILHTLTAFWKAIREQYQYICCDEALTCLTEKNRDAVYKEIIEGCKKSKVHLAIIHPGYSVPRTKSVQARKNDSQQSTLFSF